MSKAATLQPPPAAYSITAFADQLSISRGTVFNLIKRGELRVAKIGTRTVVPATEIDRLLAVDDPD